MVMQSGLGGALQLGTGIGPGGIRDALGLAIVVQQLAGGLLAGRQLFGRGIGNLRDAACDVVNRTLTTSCGPGLGIVESGVQILGHQLAGGIHGLAELLGAVVGLDVEDASFRLVVRMSDTSTSRCRGP